MNPDSSQASISILLLLYTYIIFVIIVGKDAMRPRKNNSASCERERKYVMSEFVIKKDSMEFAIDTVNDLKQMFPVEVMGDKIRELITAQIGLLDVTGFKKYGKLFSEDEVHVVLDENCNLLKVGVS